MRILVRRVWLGETLERQNQQDLGIEWKWEVREVRNDSKVPGDQLLSDG